MGQRMTAERADKAVSCAVVMAKDIEAIQKDHIPLMFFG